MLETLYLLGKISGALIPIATGLWGLYRYFLKPKVIIPVKDRIIKFDSICENLSPNCGGSLYDKIHSIDNRLSITNLRTEGLTIAKGIMEWLCDASGHCINANDVVCITLNRPEADFLGNNWVDVVHEEDRAKVIAEWKYSLETQKTFKIRCRLMHNNGQSIIVDIIYRPYYNSSNKLIGYLGIGQAIK